MEANLVIDRGTFRQLAVLMAMQGLLANPEINREWNAQRLAQCAVENADALLESMTIDEPSPSN